MIEKAPLWETRPDARPGREGRTYRRVSVVDVIRVDRVLAALSAEDVRAPGGGRAGMEAVRRVAAELGLDLRRPPG